MKIPQLTDMMNSEIVWFYLLLVTPYMLTTVTSQDEGTKRDDRNVLHMDDIIEDVEHIRAHLEDEMYIDTSKMTTHDISFHYFRSHDINHDTKLDGLELLKAMGHNVDKQLALLDSLEIPEEAKEKQKEAVARQSIGHVDRILREDDTNSDGYLSYAEYQRSRRSAKLFTARG